MSTFVKEHATVRSQTTVTGNGNGRVDDALPLENEMHAGLAVETQPAPRGWWGTRRASRMMIVGGALAAVGLAAWGVLRSRRQKAERLAAAERARVTSAPAVPLAPVAPLGYDARATMAADDRARESARVRLGGGSPT